MGIEDFLTSGNIRMDQQLKFTAEIDKMTGIIRRTSLIDKSRRENDAEHSWHIAVMAMLFEEYAVEPVNVPRAVEMCVVHDLIEIYAGDTFAYDVNANDNAIILFRKYYSCYSIEFSRNEPTFSCGKF